MHPYDSRMANDYPGFTRSKYSSGASSRQLQELIQEERFSWVTVRRGCVKSLAMNLLCKNYHEQTRPEWLKNHEMATRQICTGFPDLNVSLATIKQVWKESGWLYIWLYSTNCIEKLNTQNETNKKLSLISGQLLALWYSWTQSNLNILGGRV